MIKLKDSIVRRQLNYKLVKRTDEVAMYEMRYNAESKYPSGYEVFIIHKNADRNIKGNFIPANESLPRDDDFGKTAFAPATREHAEIRYNQLIERVNDRNKNKTTIGKRSMAG